MQHQASVPEGRVFTRCAAPGHKKAMRAAQQAELGPTPQALESAGASRITAFTAATIAVPADVLDIFLEVDPDVQNRLLKYRAADLKRSKRQQNYYAIEQKAR